MARRSIEQPAAAPEPQEPDASRDAESREARFAGLPTPEDVHAQLRMISGAFHIADRKPDSVPFALDVPPPRDVPELTHEQYEEFRREFDEDVSDFALRVQRLKLRALTPYLAGTIPNPPGLSYDEEKHTAGGRLTQLTAAYFNKEKLLDASGSSELIHEVNQRLPKEFALRPFDRLTRADAEQCYELSLALRYDKLPEPTQRQKLERILSDIQAIERTLGTIRQQGELFHAEEKHFISERRYAELWDRYRELLKEVATVEELGSWYSPTYGTSGKGQRGKEQRSEPFLSDYQRFTMPEAKKLEAALNRSYVGEHEHGEHVHSLLFNGGLNALTAILTYLDERLTSERDQREQETQVKPTIFQTRNIYFEVDQLLHRHWRELGVQPKEFDPGDVDQLAVAIKRDLPHAVFLNPMSNMYSMEVTPVVRLLEALSDQEWGEEARERLIVWKSEMYTEMRDIVIVIDNSTLGRLAKWRESNFPKLPKFVKIIAFESLIKYAQDGQELAQAGLLTTVGEGLDFRFTDIRSRMGFMPPESTVRRLAAMIPEDVTDRKMARHSRNALLIAEALEVDARDPGSFVDEVVYPGLPSHPHHRMMEREIHAAGGLLSIGLRMDLLRTYQERHTYRDRWGEVEVEREHRDRPVSEWDFSKQSKEVAEAFRNLVTLLAKEAGVAVNQGTSYGFRTTRIAAYERERENDPRDGKDAHEYSMIAYIRLAPGTENSKDTRLIAAIIKRANAIFSQAIKEGKLYRLAGLLGRNPETFTMALG